MEQQLQLIITHFYKMDFQKVSAQSKQLHAISDDELRFVLNPNTYFEHSAGYSLYDCEEPDLC
jgi:hypothetical protein